MRDPETGRCACCGRLDDCGCTDEPGCHPAPSSLPFLIAALGAAQAAKGSRFGGRR